jgi:hypothetical protein
MAATAQLAPIPRESSGAFLRPFDRPSMASRPFFGWVSDQIGGENAMFIVFRLEAFEIWMLSQFAQYPVSFVRWSLTSASRRDRDLAMPMS